MNKSKKHSILRFIPILVITTLVGVVCFFIGKKIGLNTDTTVTNTNIEDVVVDTKTISKTITSSGEIESSSTEKLSLSTSYYFDSMCVEEDDIVKKGEKILKYTNGTYLEAPYDLVITKIVVPTSGTKSTSSNYIEVKNIEELIVNISINESEISNISLDQEVVITLNSDSNKKYTGTISKIDSIGNYSSSGTTFGATVNIENDGYIKIGMSATCTINIDKKEDVVAVPINAVQINGDRRYVIFVEDDTAKEVDVETGLSNDEYVEIKSGLSVGDIVRVTTITKQSTIRNSSSSSDKKNNGSSRGGDSSFSSKFGNSRGEMPNRAERPN